MNNNQYMYVYLCIGRYSLLVSLRHGPRPTAMANAMAKAMGSARTGHSPLLCPRSRQCLYSCIRRYVQIQRRTRVCVYNTSLESSRSCRHVPKIIVQRSAKAPFWQIVVHNLCLQFPWFGDGRICVVCIYAHVIQTLIQEQLNSLRFVVKRSL